MVPRDTVGVYFETIHYATIRAKYLRQTIVLMWNSALRETFDFYFQEVLC